MYIKKRRETHGGVGGLTVMYRRKETVNRVPTLAETSLCPHKCP